MQSTQQKKATSETSGTYQEYGMFIDETECADAGQLINKVEARGGNKYKVTIGDKVRTIDLDGFTVVSDDDFELIEQAGLDEDHFISPKHHNGDLFWKAAAEHAINYSGFDASEYIKENK